MTKEVFLLINLCVAFYNVGTIWAMEVDIFRNWKVLNRANFRLVQGSHWKKLPYWIFIPLALSLAGSIALLLYHPDKLPTWEVSIPLALQLVSHGFTAVFWGQWQYKLSIDKAGAKSRYLLKILKTHWMRTALWNANAIALLWMTVQVLP
jgi:hypothetical protein